MAELVDALVSKTNEVILVPVRSRPRVQNKIKVNKTKIIQGKAEVKFLNRINPDSEVRAYRKQKTSIRTPEAKLTRLGVGRKEKT